MLLDLLVYVALFFLGTTMGLLSIHLGLSRSSLSIRLYHSLSHSPLFTIFALFISSLSIILLCLLARSVRLALLPIAYESPSAPTFCVHQQEAPSSSLVGCRKVSLVEEREPLHTVHIFFQLQEPPSSLLRLLCLLSRKAIRVEVFTVVFLPAETFISEKTVPKRAKNYVCG